MSTLILLAIVAGAVILFVTEKVRVDVTSICILGALLLTGMIAPEQALYGFASPATATVAAMFVLSAGLVRTGFVEWLARKLDGLAGSTQTQLIVVLCLAVALLSAFVVNTATVAILIPVAISLGKARKVVASRVLIPLSFASQFGGVCTLVGTSTNILVNTIAVDSGLKGFGLFEFARLGVIMVAIGVVYLVLVSRWLLPKRAGEEQSIDRYRLSDYLAEFRVGEGSPVIGRNWGEMDQGKVHDVDLIKILRDEKATWRATATKIREGDLLLLHGNADELLKLRGELRLEGRADEAISDQKMSSEDVRLVEALIPPRSLLEGRSLKTLDFARRYRCIALALQRRGTILRNRLANIKLEAGDTLLIQCETREVQRMMRSRDLVVTNELTELNLRRDKVLVSVGMVAMVVVLAALGIVPILTAAIIGAVGMVLGKCITIEEAYEAIDWKVVFLLGGILPLGLALGESGTAEMLAETVMGPLLAFGPVVVLAALYITTAILTETMSNNAAAVLLAPIALSLAGLLSVDPRPFLIAITFAASTSFATPIGYQTNTMVYAPGGYRFFDFARIGIPLNLIFWATAVVLIPVLWPF